MPTAKMTGPKKKQASAKPPSRRKKSAPTEKEASTDKSAGTHPTPKKTAASGRVTKQRVTKEPVAKNRARPAVKATDAPRIELTRVSEEPPTSKAVALMLRAMNWAYDTAHNAIGGVDSVSDLAIQYRSRAQSDDAAIDSLIRWHVTYAGAAGFFSNVGGLLTLPIAIPADLASVLLLQLRMVAAIAHIRGYDTTDPKVRSLAFICLAGNSGTEVLKEFSIQLGTKIVRQGINHISDAALLRINRAVGTRLITKAGTAGLVNLSKWVPVIGGLIGGGLDASVTRGVGAMAKKTFKSASDTNRRNL